MDLEFEIVNQSIKKINRKELANKSQEYLQLSFTFKTDDWTGLTKFVLFKKDKTAYRVALANGKALVPNACLTGDRFIFMVYGVNDTVRVTTPLVSIYLVESGYTTEVENDIPDDDPTIVEAIYTAIDTKANLSHTHTKSDISDFTHSHTESDITDLKDYALADHNHDSRYYTEDEVDAIISSLEHRINNHINITIDKNIMQTGDEATFTAYATLNGMPVSNKTIYFYEQTEE